MTHKRRIPIDSDESPSDSQDMNNADMSLQSEQDELRDSAAAPDGVPCEEVEDLRRRCAEAEDRAEKAEDNLLRALADFDNYRRRVRAEMQQARQIAIEDFVTGLLPILDSFERAIESAEDTRDFDAVHGGVILILRQFKELLQKEGVCCIDSEGMEFDPSVHEAVMRVDSDEYPDNHVVEEVQKGYRIGDKVIRPCMVKVAKRPED